MRLLLFSGIFAVTSAKVAFVLVGPTGDNALRPSGVWQGLYEGWTAGVYDSSTVGIHPTMNTPNTVEGLKEGFLNTTTQLYEELQKNPGWECKQPDCSPEVMWVDIEPNINIWDGRDANAQCEDMVPALAEYTTVNTYLSIPPFAYADWATATATNWGAERTKIACEKPFGTSTEDAESLYESVTALFPDDNLLIVDHWLSFFMIKELPTFRTILEPRLGVEWSDQHFSKIVITQDEERGLDGRGKFFDGVGQVRDLIQSHLLQTLALLLVDPDRSDLAQAKLEIFNALSVDGCEHGQYDGWLQEDGLSYHPDFADATYSTMILESKSEQWKNTEFVMTTGKLMGQHVYSIDMYQAGGPGVVRIDIGAEEVGVADIKVYDWPLKDSSDFLAPKPGFEEDKVLKFAPDVSDSGNGFILSYDPEQLYFPAPYAIMTSGILEADYGTLFVTYPEVHQSWIIVTAGDESICLDPPGAVTRVYNPPEDCGNTPPNVCYTGETVQDLYDVTYACTDANDVTYEDVDFYQAKCHADGRKLR